MSVCLDSWANLATAAAHGLALLTGDPEILARTDLPWPTEDLRG